MAKFSKYNNPNRRIHHKPLSRTDADIIAASMALDARAQGYDVSMEWVDEQSDRLCSQSGRTGVKL